MTHFVSLKISAVASLCILVFLSACGGGGGGGSTPTPTTVDAPDIANAPAVQSYELHEAIDGYTFSNSGGAISACSVTPALPAGLTLSSGCALSGTPSATSGRTSYTVEASNTTGADSATIFIEVIQSLPAVTDVSKVYTLGESANDVVFVNNGGVGITNCSASPTLPGGLSIAADNDATTCVITGAPIAELSPTTYQITVTNGAGGGVARFITRAASSESLAGSPQITNNGTPFEFFQNVAIDTIVFANQQGAELTNCAISPDLPTGLAVALAGDACAIAGTPTEVKASTTYTVTASNGSGDATATVALSVRAVNFTLSGINNTSVDENQVYTSTDPSLSGDDPVGQLSYSVAGTDAGNFSVNGIGVVTMQAQDFESPADDGSNNVYNYTLVAKDSASNEATLAIAVTINDINDNTPVVTSAAATSTVENSTSFVYTITATDADAGTTITYSISGTDSASFTMGSSDTMRFTTAPDFENPADDNDDNVYNIIITATDDGNPSLSATEVITITVTDFSTFVNDTTVSVNEGVESSHALNAPADTTGYTFVLKTAPASAEVTLNGTQFTYYTTHALTGGVTEDTFVVSAATQGETEDVTVTVNIGVDPIYQFQWHMLNTGQTAFSEQSGTIGADLNMASTLKAGWTGDGVEVSIIDSGLEIAHEDLADNIAVNRSCDFGNLPSDNLVNSIACEDRDPTSNSTTGDHGTSVAGLTGAVGWNGRGGRGVAPGVRLRGFNLLDENTTQYSVYFAISFGVTTNHINASDVDIFSQSFGISTTDDILINSLIDATYWDGVNNLRGGMGALYVKSAGNGFSRYPVGSTEAPCELAQVNGVTCQNANMDPTNAQPYNIVVAAINADDEVSSYSSWGSNIWISGYGGEFGRNLQYLDFGIDLPSPEDEPAMITTDQSGCNSGYVTRTRRATGTIGIVTLVLEEERDTPFHNPNSADGRRHNPDCNYTSSFNGTSSAAPVISGVIALLLEANPNLTWRDVKHILASTATQIDENRAEITINASGTNFIAEDGWITNAANFTFHNAYGFGKPNVDAAVAMATNNYQNLSVHAITEWFEYGTGGTNGATLALAIPDNSTTGATTGANITGGSTITIVESVQIEVDITHTRTADMSIELTSPNGTRSVMLNAHNGFGNTDDLDNMQLLSNAFYGENVDGVWTLKVVDVSADATGSINSWKIRFFGRN